MLQIKNDVQEQSIVDFERHLDPWPVVFCAPMPTALAHIFCEDGLVVAADGFNHFRYGNEVRVESQRVQKIFELPGIDRAVACAFYGRVTLINDTDERVFSFISAVRDAAKAVADKPVRSAEELAALICPLVLEKLDAVKRAGKLEYPHPEPRSLGDPGYTLVRVFVDGYFSGSPYRAGIRLFHDAGELDWDLRLHELDPWKKTRLYGSREISRLLFRTEDSRLAKYRTDAVGRIADREVDVDIPVRMEDAIEAARCFIRACSDPIAREIERDSYQRIGGELQLATITANDGFQWRYRPDQFDSLE